jgi:hypothetical protein
VYGSVFTILSVSLPRIVEIVMRNYQEVQTAKACGDGLQLRVYPFSAFGSAHLENCLHAPEQIPWKCLTNSLSTAVVWTNVRDRTEAASWCEGEDREISMCFQVEACRYRPLVDSQQERIKGVSVEGTGSAKQRSGR